jgi:hypothetical protein
MRMRQARSLSVKAKNLTLELRQAANGKARGAFRFNDVNSRAEFRLVEAGVLQAHGSWASFTARLASGAEERAALVIVDGGNPMRAQATIRVVIEGERPWEATLNPREHKVDIR